MEAAWSSFMGTGIPPWDAPPHFFRWMRAAEDNDADAVFRLPLTKENWLAAKWLFLFPGFQRRYTKLTFDMLRAALSKG